MLEHWCGSVWGKGSKAKVSITAHDVLVDVDAFKLFISVGRFSQNTKNPTTHNKQAYLSENIQFISICVYIKYILLALYLALPDGRLALAPFLVAVWTRTFYSILISKPHWKILLIHFLIEIKKNCLFLFLFIYFQNQSVSWLPQSRCIFSVQCDTSVFICCTFYSMVLYNLSIIHSPTRTSYLFWLNNNQNILGVSKFPPPHISLIIASCLIYND